MLREFLYRWFRGRVPRPTPATRSPLVTRVPRIGDPLWWGSKRTEGLVSKVNQATFEFVSGPSCKTPSGRLVAHRFTTAARIEDAQWDDSLHVWIVGRGPTPKIVRGIIVRPEPVVMKGGVG